MAQGNAALRLINSGEFLTGSTTTPRYLPETQELAVYTDQLLTKTTGKELATRVAVAFPEMTPAKAMILIEMMIDEGFTVQRAKDSVKQVIKQHIAWGKEPPIGVFIQFDKRVNTYSYRQMDSMVRDGKADYKDFAIVRIEGVSGCRSAEAAGNFPRYILRHDANLYGIETREPKPVGMDWPD